MVSEEFEAGNEKEFILRTGILLGKGPASFNCNYAHEVITWSQCRGLVVG